MAPSPQIATAYVLPYAASLGSPPLISGGRGFELQVIAQSSIQPEVKEYYSGLITPLALFAATGALAGQTENPADSVNLVWSGPVELGTMLTWDFSSCYFDERAAVLLLQYFQLGHTSYPLRAVNLVPHDRTSIALLPHHAGIKHPYPLFARQLPFIYYLDPDIEDAMTIRVEFDRDATPEEQEDIQSFISIWAIMLQMGLYGIAPTPLERCTALPDEAGVFFRSRMEFSVTRFRAHVDAFAGLVNIMVCIHQTLIPVREVSIE